MYKDDILVDHFYHEPMARENGRPLPVQPTLNKLLSLSLFIVIIISISSLPNLSAGLDKPYFPI